MIFLHRIWYVGRAFYRVSDPGRFVRFVRFVVLVNCLICRLALAVPICGSCGYENGAESHFCSHCGQSLSEGVSPRAAKDDAPPPADGAPEVASGVIPTEVVAEDVHAARRALAAGNVELARLYAGNALALNLLSGSDVGESRSTSILHLIEKCSRLEGQTRSQCPVCRGSGKALMTARSLNGSTQDLQVDGMRCERCMATGTIRGMQTVDERKYARGRAIEKYRTLQQSAGRVPVALAWVPAEVAPALNLHDTVVLKRAIPPACQRCGGFGRSDCSSCRGRGSIKCRAKGCERGRVERESTGGALGGGLGAQSVYTVECAACTGSGVERCEKCSGDGSIVCKSCSGSGSAAVCDKCSGSGLLSCRRCLGARVYRDEACRTCAAEGSVECPSCIGTGRDR